MEKLKKRLICLLLLLCLCMGVLLCACGAQGAEETLPESSASLRNSAQAPLELLSASNVIEDPYYGGGSLPVVTTPVYWPKNAPDYNTRINLISGKTPIVKSGIRITGETATEYFNSLEVLPQLTDGEYATRATYSDPALVHFTRGRNRELYFDLGYTSAVSGAKFSFLQEDSTAVNLPEAVSIALSDDGIGWQTVYRTRDLSVPRTDTFCRTEVAFDQVYAARFVRITFNVSIHVFCDELQVYGTKAIPEDAATVVPQEEDAPENRGYIMPEDFLGVHNVLLSYHCQGGGSAHPEQGLITQEEYRPYVGYYDPDGNLTDTFFDGFLYLPYTAFNYGDYARTLAGWNYYLDDIFYPNRNMDALNKEVGSVADALSLEDYRCTVFTSVLYPWETFRDGTTVNTFGDLDGDGKNDAFSSLENRKKAVKWMMEQEYNRFFAGGYEHLTFGGFYWFEESLAFYNADERELVQYAADYAHSLGVKLFWIPYYCAAGYDRWEDFGLDLACMQPNYMFGNRNSPEVLQITADLTKELGMCVEIEISNVNDDGDRSRYREYLEAGAKYGYMYAVKMYYQDGVPGAFYNAWASSDPKKREIYEMTYLYAKERFGATTVTPGDVNGDGSVTDADLQLLMEALAGMRTLTGSAFGAADLNNNGILDAQDLTGLLQTLE